MSEPTENEGTPPSVGIRSVRKHEAAYRLAECHAVAWVEYLLSRFASWARTADAWTLLAVNRDFAASEPSIGTALDALEEAFLNEWIFHGGKVAGSRIDVRFLGMRALDEGVDATLANYPHLEREDVERALEAVRPFARATEAIPEVKP